MRSKCPNAAINPATGEAVSKQVVYDILENRCSDIDPSMPWSHQKRLVKSAVLPHAFLERCDLHGPAQGCRHNGVASADLLEFTEAGLLNDLRVTPFAARKILAARASFCDSI